MDTHGNADNSPLVINADDISYAIDLFVDPEPSDPKKPKVNPPRAKHQAVFHLDFETWEDIVRAFEIKQCIIPHRNSDAGIQISASGWYA